MEAPFIGGLTVVAMFLLIACHVPIGIAMGITGVLGTGLIIGFEPIDCSLFSWVASDVYMFLCIVVVVPDSLCQISSSCVSQPPRHQPWST